MLDNMMKGMFGKLSNGMCRLSMTGAIAVKTTDGYKSYNPKSDRLVNCNQFTFDGMDEMFFVIPTNNVKVSDVILVKGTPRCVTEVNKNRLTVLNYETNTIETILPERHVFMGNTYFYGKIVSMFGNFACGGKKGSNKMMKMYMMGKMMESFSGKTPDRSGGNMMETMMMANMFGGGFGDGIGEMFDGIFDDDEENPISEVAEAMMKTEDNASEEDGKEEE